VQGRIVCDGYIRDSIVVAGPEAALTVDDGYIWGSVAAAGKIECSGYYNLSLLGGKIGADSSGNADLRESSRFDAAPIYRYWRGADAKQEK
jgi:hypothetical protein